MRQNVEKLRQTIFQISSLIQQHESAIHRINNPEEIVKIQFEVVQLRQQLKRIELDVQQQKKERLSQFRG